MTADERSETPHDESGKGIYTQLSTKDPEP